MKMMILLGCLLYVGISANGQSPTFGWADTVHYDAIGNRIKREYQWSVVAPKQNGQQEHPVDTLVQTSKKLSLIVKAYPNPASDQLIVENLNWKTDDKVTIKILDIAGKLLQSRAVYRNKEAFSLAGFSPGVYQVHYYLQNKILTTWKIVKN